MYFIIPSKLLQELIITYIYIYVGEERKGYFVILISNI